MAAIKKITAVKTIIRNIPIPNQSDWCLAGPVVFKSVTIGIHLTTIIGSAALQGLVTGDGRKTNATIVREVIGVPSSVPGLNVQLLTAASAACVSEAMRTRATDTWVTPPLRLTVTSSTSVPDAVPPAGYAAYEAAETCGGTNRPDLPVWLGDEGGGSGML